jgi:hypothetical protein
MIAMLTPSTLWFGIPPWLLADGGSDTRTLTRRISRSATLDGGALINDGGYCDADRTMTLALRGLTQAQAQDLETIAAYPVCYLSLPHGLYRGTVQALALNGEATARVTFWVHERVV